MPSSEQVRAAATGKPISGEVLTAELLNLISYHRNRAESRLRGLRAGNRVKPGELQKARESLEMLTRIQAAGRGETDDG